MKKRLGRPKKASKIATVTSTGETVTLTEKDLITAILQYGITNLLSRN